LKTIAVILPVNNPEMVSQQFFDHYQDIKCRYVLTYIKTHLKELNTADDANAVMQPTIDAVMAAEKKGADAAIIFAFGDVAVKEASKQVAIPVLGTGKYAIHVAAEICESTFTVLPGKLLHNSFIQPMVAEMGLTKNFVLSTHDADLFPAEIRQDPALAISRLFDAACKEIGTKGIDTFTMGCTCFMGMAKPLKAKLQEKYKGQRKISVIDPGEIALAIARELV
jgi:Asp/Glu/hydantoin racemase